MRLRITGFEKRDLRCENCGVELTQEKAYTREINGEKHYFCCSHCADEFDSPIGGCC
ncbi:transcriptional regulator [Sulfolobales archaeon HS-7]|nr:transcriptional regulator [Sulfolobales archaeon HS-7]